MYVPTMAGFTLPVVMTVVVPSTLSTACAPASIYTKVVEATIVKGF